MKSQHTYISNFKFSPTETTNDSLQIDFFENVNLSNGIISSEITQDDILLNFLSKAEFNSVTENNSKIINKLIQIIPYEYFDNTNKTTKLRLLAIDNEFNLYELDTVNYIFTEKHKFNEFPNIIESKSVLYFFDKNNCTIFEENNLMQIENLPKILSFTEYENQLFFIANENPYSIYQCEETELKNLSNNLEQYQSYNLNFEDGCALNISVINNKLFVFSQYAIHKLDLENSKLLKQNEPKISIYPNTIERLDDEVIFYSSNGLYSFDGNDTEKLSSNYLNLEKNAKSLCFNQNYYIKSSIHDEFLYKFDFESKYFLPLKFDKLVNFGVIKSSEIYNIFVCNFINETYKNITLYNNSSNFNQVQLVKFKPTLFGSTKLKQIENIHLKCEGEFTLKIKSNLTEKCVTISNSTSIKNLLISGNIFDIEIKSTSFFKIKSILIEYLEVGE